MTQPRRPGAQDARRDVRSGGPEPKATGLDPRGAGVTLVAAALACAGVGLGFGVVVGLPIPFALAGFFAGLAVGFALVYLRFKDI